MEGQAAGCIHVGVLPPDQGWPSCMQLTFNPQRTEDKRLVGLLLLGQDGLPLQPAGEWGIGVLSALARMVTERGVSVQAQLLTCEAPVAVVQLCVLFPEELSSWKAPGPAAVTIINAMKPLHVLCDLTPALIQPPTQSANLTLALTGPQPGGEQSVPPHILSWLQQEVQEQEAMVKPDAKQMYTLSSCFKELPSCKHDPTRPSMCYADPPGSSSGAKHGVSLHGLPEHTLQDIMGMLDPKSLARLLCTCRYMQVVGWDTAPGLKLTLYPHQRAAVRWMVLHESHTWSQSLTSTKSTTSGPADRLEQWAQEHPIYRTFIQSNGLKVYANTATGELSTAPPPPAHQMLGGFFCDEPGLGKTVTAMSLILKSLGRVPSPPPTSTVVWAQPGVAGFYHVTLAQAVSDSSGSHHSHTTHVSDVPVVGRTTRRQTRAAAAIALPQRNHVAKAGLPLAPVHRPDSSSGSTNTAGLQSTSAGLLAGPPPLELLPPLPPPPVLALTAPPPPALTSLVSSLVSTAPPPPPLPPVTDPLPVNLSQLQPFSSCQLAGSQKQCTPGQHTSSISPPSSAPASAPASPAHTPLVKRRSGSLRELCSLFPTVRQRKSSKSPPDGPTPADKPSTPHATTPSASAKHASKGDTDRPSTQAAPNRSKQSNGGELAGSTPHPHVAPPPPPLQPTLQPASFTQGNLQLLSPTVRKRSAVSTIFGMHEADTNNGPTTSPAAFRPHVPALSSPLHSPPKGQKRLGALDSLPNTDRIAPALARLHSTPLPPRPPGPHSLAPPPPSIHAALPAAARTWVGGAHLQPPGTMASSPSSSSLPPTSYTANGATGRVTHQQLLNPDVLFQLSHVTQHAAHSPSQPPLLQRTHTAHSIRADRLSSPAGNGGPVSNGAGFRGTAQPVAQVAQSSDYQQLVPVVGQLGTSRADSLVDSHMQLAVVDAPSPDALSHHGPTALVIASQQPQLLQGDDGGRQVAVVQPEVTNITYVQCEACDKWRALPVGHQIDASHPWFCDMHPEPSIAQCSVPEDDTTQHKQFHKVVGFLEPGAEPGQPHNVDHFFQLLTSLPSAELTASRLVLNFLAATAKPAQLLLSNGGLRVPSEVRQARPGNDYDGNRYMNIMKLLDFVSIQAYNNQSGSGKGSKRSSSSKGSSHTLALTLYGESPSPPPSTSRAKRSTPPKGAQSVALMHTWIQPVTYGQQVFDQAALRLALARCSLAGLIPWSMLHTSIAQLKHEQPEALLSAFNQNDQQIRMFLSPATLVVVPSTLVAHWRHQLSKHVRQGLIRLCELTSESKLSMSTKDLAWNHDVVITTFNRLASEWAPRSMGGGLAGQSIRSGPGATQGPALLQVHWLRVIIDEGHMLGASLGETNKLQVACQLRAERRWIMTGTPTPTNTDSGAAHLQPLLAFLRHQPYGISRKVWEASVLRPLDACKPHGRQQLMRLLRSTMIRACKSDLQLLPPLHRTVTRLDFAPDHAASYNALVEVVRRNLLLADWSDEDHVESLMNKRQSKWAKEMMNNVRLSCCVAGSMDLVASEDDLEESLVLLCERLNHPWPAAAWAAFEAAMIARIPPVLPPADEGTEVEGGEQQQADDTQQLALPAPDAAREPAAGGAAEPGAAGGAGGAAQATALSVTATSTDDQVTGAVGASIKAVEAGGGAAGAGSATAPAAAGSAGSAGAGSSTTPAGAGSATAPAAAGSAGAASAGTGRGKTRSSSSNKTAGVAAAAAGPSMGPAAGPSSSKGSKSSRQANKDVPPGYKQGVVAKTMWQSKGRVGGMWLPPGHPLERVEKTIRDGGMCESCSGMTRYPFVTPCGHITCLDCAASSRTHCPVPSCNTPYKMQSIDDPARAKYNPNPKWEVPIEVIEWQPVYTQAGAEGISGGEWSATWEITRSTRCQYLVRSLTALGLKSPASDTTISPTHAPTSVSAAVQQRQFMHARRQLNSTGSGSRAGGGARDVMMQVWEPDTAAPAPVVLVKEAGQGLVQGVQEMVLGSPGGSAAAERTPGAAAVASLGSVRDQLMLALTGPELPAAPQSVVSVLPASGEVGAAADAGAADGVKRRKVQWPDETQPLAANGHASAVACVTAADHGSAAAVPAVGGGGGGAADAKLARKRVLFDTGSRVSHVSTAQHAQESADSLSHWVPFKPAQGDKSQPGAEQQLSVVVLAGVGDKRQANQLQAAGSSPPVSPVSPGSGAAKKIRLRLGAFSQQRPVDVSNRPPTAASTAAAMTASGMQTVTSAVAGSHEAVGADGMKQGCGGGLLSRVHEEGGAGPSIAVNGSSSQGGVAGRQEQVDMAMIAPGSITTPQLGPHASHALDAQALVPAGLPPRSDAVQAQTELDAPPRPSPPSAPTRTASRPPRGLPFQRVLLIDKGTRKAGTLDTAGSSSSSDLMVPRRAGSRVSFADDPPTVLPASHLAGTQPQALDTASGSQHKTSTALALLPPPGRHAWRAGAAKPKSILKHAVSLAGSAAGGQAACSRVNPSNFKVIVFSQFWMHLKLIGQELTRHNIKHVLLKSGSKHADRQAALDVFTFDRSVGVLLMDDTGAVGLDLSFVTHVYLMEPLADKSLEHQIVSRAHRMGATRPVHVEQLVMRNTGEEQMLQMFSAAPRGEEQQQALGVDMGGAGEAGGLEGGAQEVEEAAGGGDGRAVRNSFFRSLHMVATQSLADWQDD